MSAAKHPKPASFDQAAGVIWRRTIKQLKELGFFEDADLPLIERYVLALEMARRQREKIVELEALEGTWVGEELHLGAYTTGSTGQLVAHPAVKMARDAEADAQKYAEALLLTPASRARAHRGAKKTEADEPDLAALLAG